MWRVLQLCDAAFPSGGFAHSAGLEASMVLRDGLDVEAFLDASLRQTGRATLPFVRSAALDPSQLAALDDAYDATLPMTGPNHASRAQGRALASAAGRVWEGPLAAVVAHARQAPSHHGPVFGAICGTLGIGAGETLAGYLHQAARGVLSAAVRLGLLGPIEAQRIQAERAAVFDAIVAETGELETAAQTAPLIEIFSALHERLDGRMFQS